jgi:hypothetical protein
MRLRLLLLAALPLGAAPAAANTPPHPARLAVASGLRVRASNQPGAAVLERVGVGTVLSCLEQTGVVKVGATSGPFCRTRLEDGREGWFHASQLTAEVEADLEAQLDRLVEGKARELAGSDRQSDLYDLHRLVLRRMERAKDAPARLRARLAELALLRENPATFHADPRLYRDEAQGPRLKRDVLWALADEAKATPGAGATAEAAAWAAVEHGHDFECEGDAVCAASWLPRVECAYLSRFPSGAHAGQAADALRATADWVVKEGLAQTEADRREGLLAPLEEALRCVAEVKGSSAGQARRSLTRAVSAVKRAAAPARPAAAKGP